MRSKRMPSDEAYKFVKSRRPSISPNFNFMGQLMEYERQLRERHLLPPLSNRPYSFTCSNLASIDGVECGGAARRPTSIDIVNLRKSLSTDFITGGKQAQLPKDTSPPVVV